MTPEDFATVAEEIGAADTYVQRILNGDGMLTGADATYLSGLLVKCLALLGQRTAEDERRDVMAYLETEETRLNRMVRELESGDARWVQLTNRAKALASAGDAIEHGDHEGAADR